MAKRAPARAAPAAGGRGETVRRADYGMQIDGYVAKLPSPRREIAQALRGIIREAAPEVSEAIKWGQPTYELNGMFCYFVAAKDYVRFGFFRQGIMLENPKGLLEGTGKEMRHIKLRTMEDIKPQLFRKWVRRAAELNKGA